MNTSRAPDGGFRLIQLSDCHLPARAESSYRGVNADHGLQSVLAVVAQWQPDALLLTGDLSEDASVESYERLVRRVKMLNVPVFALPGNHDDPVVMKRFFPEGPYAGPWVQQLAGWKLALLDSSRPGRIDGTLENSELDALVEEMSGDEPCLIALHHQPIPVNAPWIDRYMLDASAEFLAYTALMEQLRIVTWGHVHQEFQQDIGKVRFMSAPSSAANSLSRTQRFSLDPSGPACRWFELYPDGHFESGILVAAL